MKTINDTYGHAEGDRALVDTAAILLASLRIADVVARVGGDEFCALLVDCPLEAARSILDRIREGVERHNATAGRPYRLSVSMGVASNEQGCDIEELMVKADHSMYLDKAGRT
jgi:diguanylate cyclase (GGDEF)-like protein